MNAWKLTLFDPHTMVTSLPRDISWTTQTPLHLDECRSQHYLLGLSKMLHVERVPEKGKEIPKSMHTMAVLTMMSMLPMADLVSETTPGGEG
jgi:hypothetical protein